MGFNDSEWRPEVFIWVFEVVLVTGFCFSFYTGTFFEPYMFPVFVVEVAFFGWSSVEVVDEVSNSVFYGGTFSVHVSVWWNFKLNPLVDFIGYIFASSDGI